MTQAFLAAVPLARPRRLTELEAAATTLSLADAVAAFRRQSGEVWTSKARLEAEALGNRLAGLLSRGGKAETERGDLGSAVQRLDLAAASAFLGLAAVCALAAGQIGRAEMGLRLTLALTSDRMIVLAARC